MTKQEMARFRKRKARILALAAKGIPHPVIARKMGLNNRQRVWQIINGK